jgi:hypothetical protein
MAAELLALAFFLPGVGLVSMMFLGAPLAPWAMSFVCVGLLAAAAWVSTYFHGIGYIRTGALLEMDHPRWTRLIAILGPAPAALETMRLSFFPSRHASAADGLFFIACLIWVPVVHLEVLGIFRRRSNQRLERP